MIKEIENWIRDYEEETDTIIFKNNGLLIDFAQAIGEYIEENYVKKDRLFVFRGDKLYLWENKVLTEYNPHCTCDEPKKG